MTTNRIAVVMPAYNEADGIEGFLDEIVSTFTSHSLEPVIGVIDDTSTDDTAAVLTRYSERSPHSVQIRSNETNMQYENKHVLHYPFIPNDLARLYGLAGK